jgi:hypothetical protein
MEESENLKEKKKSISITFMITPEQEMKETNRILGTVCLGFQVGVWLCLSLQVYL